MLCKILSCSFSITLYLLAQLVEVLELHLRSDKAVKLNSGLTAVEIAGIVQQMAFHIDLVLIADGGAHPHIGHSHMGAAVFKKDTGGIYAVAG